MTDPTPITTDESAQEPSISPDPEMSPEDARLWLDARVRDMRKSVAQQEPEAEAESEKQ